MSVQLMSQNVACEKDSLQVKKKYCIIFHRHLGAVTFIKNILCFL